MLKDEQNRSYNGGGDAIPLKIWSDFSSLQYIVFQFKQIHLGFDQNLFKCTDKLFCTLSFEGKIDNT